MIDVMEGENNMPEIQSVRHWTPPNKIGINKKPGFRYRWMRKSDVEMRKDEGWILAPKNHMNLPEVTSIDGAAHYRSMILMMLPEDMAKDRDAHYVDKHARRVRAAVQGASLADAADKLNAKFGGKVFGTDLGKTVIQSQHFDDKKFPTKTEQVISSDDVNPEDIKELMTVNESKKLSNENDLEEEVLIVPSKNSKRK